MHRDGRNKPGVRGGVARSLSVQAEFAVDRAKLRRLDQLAVRDAHRVQRTFELFLPEGEEAMQLREFRKQVVVLPDVGLQQPAMIGAAIQDVRGGQTVATDLLAEIL